jgi:hypothetical protein
MLLQVGGSAIDHPQMRTAYDFLNDDYTMDRQRIIKITPM